jgi:prephenate dehydratase
MRPALIICHELLLEPQLNALEDALEQAVARGVDHRLGREVKRGRHANAHPQISATHELGAIPLALGLQNTVELELKMLVKGFCAEELAVLGLNAHLPRFRRIDPQPGHWHKLKREELQRSQLQAKFLRSELFNTPVLRQASHQPLRQCQIMLNGNPRHLVNGNLYGLRGRKLILHGLWTPEPPKQRLGMPPYPTLSIPRSARAIRKIYPVIMAVSIAHLGPAGTYAEIAAMVFAQSGCLPAGAEVHYIPHPTIAQALTQTSAGHADWAVVPVENSVEGSVPMTLDTVWHQPALNIHQGLVLPIDHAFIGSATRLSQIKAIYSHPQALAQCQGWLDQHLPQVERVAVNSTAQAVQLIADNSSPGSSGNPEKAAIASLRAASLYHMPVLDYPINDHPGNCTRFWALSRQPSPGGDYTSIGFSVHDGSAPGVLVESLQIFAQAGISMVRIESRPTKRTMGDYRFFVDLEGNAKTSPLAEALQRLKTRACTYQLLGSYKLLTIESQAVAKILGQS